MRVTVVGWSGRVGRAVIPHLIDRVFAIELVERGAVEAAGTPSGFRSFADRLTGRTLLNMAGRAHLKRSTHAYGDLWRSNVALPLALLDAALLSGANFVHLSSSKACGEPKTAYAMSKQCAETALEFQHARSADPVGVTCVRPCAVLAPPFDAGKLGMLVRVPASATSFAPKRRIPVVSPAELAAILASALTRNPGDQGFQTIDVGPSSMMTLREVMTALNGPR